MRNKQTALIILIIFTITGSILSASLTDTRQKAYTLFLLGANTYAANNNTDAIRYLEKALLLDPQLEAARGILIIALGEEALLQYEDGQYERALPNLNKLLRLLPDDIEIRKIYEQARKKHPQSKMLASVEDSAVNLQNQYRMDWMGYIGLGRASDRLDERIEYIEKLFATYAGTTVNTEQIEQEIQKLFSERKSLFASYSKKERLAHALVLYQQDRFLEAVEIWEDIKARSPDPDVEYYLIEAYAALEEKLSAALSEAQTLKNAGKWDKALVSLKKALSINPQNPSARLGIKEIHADLTKFFNKGVAAYQSKDYKKAVEHWQMITVYYPGYRAIDRYINQANAIMRKGEKKTRYSLVKAYIRNGDTFQKQGRFNAAVKMWKKALAVDPADTVASERIKKTLGSLYKLADSNDRIGKKARALEIWKMIVSIDPGYRNVKKKLTKTVTRRSVDVSSLIAEGEKAFNAGEYLAALVSLKKALRSKPRNQKAVRLATESALAQGIVYYRSDKLSDAIAQWNYVLKYIPRHEKAIKYRQRAQLKLETLEKFK